MRDRPTLLPGQPPLPGQDQAVDTGLSLALPDGDQREELLQSLRTLQEAARWNWPVAMCEALTDVARCLAALHAYPAAHAYLVGAFEWARQMGGAHDTLADLSCAMAEVACNEADLLVLHDEQTPAALGRLARARQRARHHATEASGLARATTDSNWEAAVLLRAADVLERGGDLDDAVVLQRQAMALVEPISPNAQHAARHGVLRHAAPDALM